MWEERKQTSCIGTTCQHIQKDFEYEMICHYYAKSICSKLSVSCLLHSCFFQVYTFPHDFTACFIIITCLVFSLILCLSKHKDWNFASGSKVIHNSLESILHIHRKNFSCIFVFSNSSKKNQLFYITPEHNVENTVVESSWSVF